MKGLRCSVSSIPESVSQNRRNIDTGKATQAVSDPGSRIRLPGSIKARSLPATSSDKYREVGLCSAMGHVADRCFMGRTLMTPASYRLRGDHEIDLPQQRSWTTSRSPTIGQSMFKRSVANNRGECSKRVSLSRPSCMTDKGARVALAVGGVPKTGRHYVSVSVPLATSLFVAACFQYPTVKRCRRWVGRSSSSIIATA